MKVAYWYDGFVDVGCWYDVWLEFGLYEFVEVFDVYDEEPLL